MAIHSGFTQIVIFISCLYVYQRVLLISCRFGPPPDPWKLSSKHIHWSFARTPSGPGPNHWCLYHCFRKWGGSFKWGITKNDGWSWKMPLNWMIWRNNHFRNSNHQDLISIYQHPTAMNPPTCKIWDKQGCRHFSSSKLGRDVSNRCFLRWPCPYTCL